MTKPSQMRRKADGKIFIVPLWPTFTKLVDPATGAEILVADRTIDSDYEALDHPDRTPHNYRWP